MAFAFALAAIAPVHLAEESHDGAPLRHLAHQRPLIAQKVTDTAWDEMKMTWNNQPATASPTALASVTLLNSTAQWYEVDLTAFIQAERAANRNVVALRLINTVPTGNSGSFFTSINSKEAAKNQPELVIQPF
jgi:hypothetical protein